SKAIFQGTVLSVRNDPASCFKGDCHAVIVKIRVEKNFKDSHDTVDIYTNAFTGACGFPFKVGKSYLVYAEGDDKDMFATWLCSRSGDISDIPRRDNRRLK